jgi:hypothetical protein
MVASDASSQAIYEGQLQSLIRFVDTASADAGFKKLAFKTAGWVFSQYGTTNIYLLGKGIELRVFKNAFRLMGDTLEHIGQNGYTRKIFTMAQLVASAKSRCGVLTRV